MDKAISSGVLNFNAGPVMAIPFYLTQLFHLWLFSLFRSHKTLVLEENVKLLFIPAVNTQITNNTHNCLSKRDFSLVQSLSRVQLFTTPWTTACQGSLSVTNSRSSPRLISIKLVMPSNHLILCHPFLPLPSIFPSIRVFSNESALLIRWPKYWSFSFSISPSNEHSGLISFRIDWLDLLAVQGTLKSLFQHHSSKTSILWRSAFFIVQLSHPYMTTGKTIALTRQTFADKVIREAINYKPQPVFWDVKMCIL